MTITIENTYTQTGKKLISSQIQLCNIPSVANSVCYMFISRNQKTASAGKTVTSVHWDEGGVDELFSKVGVGMRENNKSIVDIWVLVNPTPGTHNFIIYYQDNNANWNGMVQTVVILSNVDQETPDDGWEGNSGFGTTLNKTVITDIGDLCYGVFEHLETMTETGDGDEQWNNQSGGSSDGAGVNYVSTDALTNFIFTTGVSQDWTAAGISINEYVEPSVTEGQNEKQINRLINARINDRIN